jgi:hypothetical protein
MFDIFMEKIKSWTLPLESGKQPKAEAEAV